MNVSIGLPAALLLTFVALSGAVMHGGISQLDETVALAFRTSGEPFDPVGPAWFEEAVRDVSSLGSYPFILLVLTSALGYLALVRLWGPAALIAGSVSGGALISHLLKVGIARPRPDLDAASRVFTASFPSGHATLSAIMFLTMGALLARQQESHLARLYLIAAALAITVLIGLSRVYLGVHFFSDVLAGWCVGTAWALICWSGAARIFPLASAPSRQS